MAENLLQDKYVDYLDLIETLCHCYDALEKETLALSISAAIRVLVHDTKTSTSLLTHLNKKSILFLTTNYTHDNEPIHLGLVRRINVGVHDGVGGEAKYWPLCNERYFPSPQNQKFLDFKEWWEKEKVFDSGDLSLTRKDLILSVANKDGGTHFDKEIEDKYDKFRYAWSGGSTLIGITSKTSRGYDNIPTYPAVRQIGHEILSTLNFNKTL